jgi:hypothetical protein
MATKQEPIDTPTSSFERASAKNKRSASEMEQDPSAGDASNWIVRQRFEHGLCHQCGNSIYDVVTEGDVKLRKRFEPITIPNVVENGRCLMCYPLQRARVAQHHAQRQDPEVLDLLEDDDSMFLSKDFLTTTTNKGGTTYNHHRDNDEDDISTGAMMGMRMEANQYPKRNSFATNRGSSRTGTIMALEDQQKQQPRSTPQRKQTHTLSDSDGLEFVGTITDGNKEQGTGKFCHGERSKIIIYEGEYESGYFHGKGKSHDHGTGCLYQGDFVKGAAHGEGTCRWDQGWEYQGEWQMDKRHGRGRCRQLVDGGEVYDGEWKDDKWDGTGVLTFSGGGKYSGSFRKDKLNGQGTYEFADGSVYTGSFTNDLRHGHGEMTYACGLRYVGEWRDNWRGGKGTLFHTDGSVFKGRFSEDEKDGTGYLHLPDGIVRKEKWVVGQLTRSP